MPINGRKMVKEALKGKTLRCLIEAKVRKAII
jgi:hypothetical protein